MLQSEFIERTGYMPTCDEYKAIEELYYQYEGDKDAFCQYFKSHKSAVLNKVREIACASFAKEREKLLNEKSKAQCETAEVKRTMEYEAKRSKASWDKEKSKYEERIAALEKQLDDTCEDRDLFRQERNDTVSELMQARRDIESLKNAIRLLKS